MPKITSVDEAKAAFPDLKWRDAPSGRSAFAICGGERTTGDITIFLAMEKGASAPTHIHRERIGWPFRESITCLAGRLFGTDPHNPDYVLQAGESIDLNDDTPHRPYVTDVGFALVTYRQPAGHIVVS